MSNKVKGILVGLGLSLLGVALWVVFAALLNIIAGIAGAVMGIGLIWGYKKFNADDKSNFIYFFGAIVMILEIIIAELISLGIIANDYGYTFSDVFQIDGVKAGVIKDILVGIVFSALVFSGYIASIKRKEKQQVKNDEIMSENTRMNNNFNNNPFINNQGNNNQNPFDNQANNDIKYENNYAGQNSNDIIQNDTDNNDLNK